MPPTTPAPAPEVGQIWRDTRYDKILPGGNQRTIKILNVFVDTVLAQVLTTTKGTPRKATPGGNVTTLLIDTLHAGYVLVTAGRLDTTPPSAEEGA